jgi:glucose dehydrogenase
MDTRWRAMFSLTVQSCFIVAVLWLFSPMIVHADDLVAMQNDPGQWVHPGKNYSLTRYSELDQIDTKNVTNL